MALSALAEKSHEPTDKDLREVLGKVYDVWKDLIDVVEQRIGQISQVWGYTSKKTGWGLRLKQKDRIILYMTPQTVKFLVSFALGERVVAAGRLRGLSPALLKAIDAAPRYADGRGLRLEVSGKRQVLCLAALAEIKSEN